MGSYSDIVTSPGMSGSMIMAREDDKKDWKPYGIHAGEEED